MIQRGTPTDLAGTALYGRARRAWNRDEDATAKVDYLLFLEKFPAHARTPDTLHALARIAEAAGDLPQAAQRYREIGERYPKSRVAETAAWRRGFAHYRNDNFTAAAEAWHMQGPTEAGDYWRARALEGLAQPRIATKIREELLQKWPMSYYAWWLAPTTTKASEPLTTPKAVPPQTATAQRHRAKANLLAQLDLPESAERELDAVRRETGNTAFLMGAYADIGAWQRSILIARALESRGGNRIRAPHSSPSPSDTIPTCRKKNMA